jgi:tetratricopeptide (TPR) repeat protein
VLLVLTFRPEFEALWQQSHVSELKLARLPRRVTRELIANAARGRLPEPVLAELEARSDGVPLFVEELTRSVVTSGVMTESAGRYELRGRLEDLAIPATLQDSLMARLDRLSASKHVAQQAATLGREFSYELIEAVSDLDAPSLRNALEQLTKAEVLHQRGTPPDASYTFKHALLQDTAYESQLLSTRRALHGKIAAALEERFPKRVASEPEVMARHCAVAGEHSKAVDYSKRAAELAVSRHANQEASDHYRRALDALLQLPGDDARKQREIAVRLAHGEALMTLHGYRAPEVLETFGRVEALCGAIGEGPQQLPALIGLAQFDMARGAVITAGERAGALLRVAEPLGIPALLVLGHYLAGAASVLISSTAEAREHLARAVETLQTVSFPPPATAYALDLVASLHGVNAIALANGGKFQQVTESMRACRERLSEIDHDFSKASSLGTFAIAWMIAEDPEATRSAAEEALAVAEGRGFHSQEALARISRGWARACQGEADEGVRDVESGFALAETSGSDTLTAFLYVAAADTYRMAGDRERATERLDQAARICERDRLVGTTPLVPAAKARILLELGGEPAEAETLFLEALGEADSVGLLWFGLITATRLARLAPHTGKVREAHDRLAARYASLREGFDRAPAREAKAALEELAAQLDGETRGRSA